METKTALLNSAESAVRSKGYNGFSYADLAEDVGIRKASIHHHFPKKEDLALALIERYRDNSLNAFDQISDKYDKAGDRLKQYFGLYRQALSGCDMLCLCISLSASSESLSEAVLKEINAFREMSINWLECVFKMGLSDGSILHISDPRIEASACLATVEGAQIMARVSGKIAHFDRAIENLNSRLV